MEEKYSGPGVASVSLGITVVCLYGFFVVMVAFGFGSYIYRTGWQVVISQEDAGDEPTKSLSDIDNLIYVLKSEDDIRASRQLVIVDIQNHRKEISDLDSKIAQSFATIARARARWQAQVNQTASNLEDFQYDLTGNARIKYELVVTQLDEAEAAALKNGTSLSLDHRVRTLLDVAAAGFEEADTDLDTKDRFAAMYASAIDLLDTHSAAHTEANAASHQMQAERVLTQERLEGLNSNRDALDVSLAELEELLPVGSSARAGLSLLSLNLPFMPDILMRLVSFPTIFLTLIVTIAAGGLGTVVAFSRRYYSSTTASTLTLSRLFVNVGEGIAAAIAIFLFSGAGMLALTQGSGPANGVELSPYTVAFIAFLSGFMAEDAFASIQAAGKRIFNQTDQNAEKAGESDEPEPEHDAEPEQAPNLQPA